MNKPELDPGIPTPVATAAEAAAAKLGKDIVIIDVAEVIGITDQFVLVSGDNNRQVKAITEEIEHRVKHTHGLGPQRVEGISEMEWVLLDYGDFIVHVFHVDARDYYQLERLWADRPTIEWDDAPTQASVS